MDVVEQKIVKQETRKFTNRVSEHGYLNLSSLNLFYQSFNITGSLYDVDIIHKKLNLEPEYRFKTAEEIIAQQNSSYTGTNIYHYTDVLSTKPEVADEMPRDLQMNTETNESVLASSRDIAADSSHIHTSDCYLGHVHLGEPCVCKEYTLSAYPENKYVKYIYVTYTCPDCEYHAREQVFFHNSQMTVPMEKYYGNVYCEACGKTIPSSDYSYDNIYDYDDEMFNLNTYYGYSDEWLESNGSLSSIMFNQNTFTGGELYPHNILLNEPHIYKFFGQSAKHVSYSHKYENGCYVFHRSRAPYGIQIGDDGCFSYRLDSYSSDAYDNFAREWYLLENIAGNVCNALIETGKIDYCVVPFYYQLYGNSHNAPGATYQLVYEEGGDSYFTLVDCIGANVYPQTLSPAGMRAAYQDTICFINECFGRTVVYHDGESHYETLNYNRRYPVSGFLCLCETESGDVLGNNIWYPSCGHDSLGTLCCDEIILSIEATHPVQTVFAGEELITTVNITYLNGSRRTAIGVCTFDTNQIGLNQTATISYDGKDSPSTTKQFTTPIQVSVLSKSNVCPNGHTYWLNSDSSDPSCPYCKVWLKSLELIAPSNGYLDMIQDTTLEQNGVKIKATHLNGTTEILTTGYLHNLDNHYVGEQTVTIGYRGMYITLMVRVHRKQKLCTICGREYELYPDGTDPGCPYCLARIPIFTGNILSYYREVPMSEILKEIEKHGIYNMSRGDEFAVRIRNKTDTLSSNLLSFFGYPKMKKISVWDTIEIRDVD